MARVLVIGGGGFIGGHLLPALVKQGDTVSATYRPGATPAPVGGVEWLQCDLARFDTSSWPAQVDRVIYMAQSRAWREFPGGAAEVFEINVAGVFRAAEYARQAGASQMIYLSSGSVYQASTSAAIEQSGFPIPAPLAFYPATKIAAELLLGPYGAMFPVVVLRPFVPYGRGQASERLLPQLVDRVRGRQAIHLDGEDGLRLNPVAVNDVVEAILRSMTLTRSATMNVAGPDVLTLRQIGVAIGDVLGVEPVFEPRPTAARSVVGDTSHLRSTLAWAPATTFDQGLRDWIS